MKHSKTSMPLYYQIVTDIKEKIEKGTFLPGEKLPTESSLSEEYGVSRVTVRNALNALKETGLVEHRVNKGYFIAQMGEKIGGHEGFSLYDDLVSMGIKPSSKILSMTTEKCGTKLSGIFGCRTDDFVIVIHRLRLANDIPFAVEMNYLPFHLFEGINPWSLEETSLIKVMEEEFGIRIAYATQTLKAVLPTPEEKKLLQLTANIPQLYIKSKVYDKQENIVKYAKVIYRTDVVEYSFVWNQ